MSDSLLDLLGDYFVCKQLHKQGWTFEQFVYEFQRGYVALI